MTNATRFLPLMLLGMEHTGAAIQTSARANNAGIVIRLFNAAHVPAAALTYAEGEASQVFALAGIPVRWQNGNSDDEARFLDQTASPCVEFLRSTELMLRIIPAVPNSLFPGALGMALPCADYGPQATIFWDRVEAAGHVVQVSISQVLGYAIAHEIGHVLLRSKEHGPEGIMRGIWRDSEWMGVAARTLSFSSEEADQMRKVLRSTRNHPRIARSASGGAEEVIIVLRRLTKDRGTRPGAGEDHGTEADALRIT